jgi:hypothetical protein
MSVVRNRNGHLYFLLLVLTRNEHGYTLPSSGLGAVLPEASALALAPQVPKTGSYLTVPIMLAVVAVCLVIGVGLRAFSKPPADLSLNQRTK